jgi:hypothetical protein
MRTRWFELVLAAIWSCTALQPAVADSMKLSILGTADGTFINRVYDVSNGFSGASINVNSSPLGAGSAGKPVSINSSISLEATLFDSSRNLASLSLYGPIQGGFFQPLNDPNLEGGISGSAFAGDLYVFPGVDPAAIPAWFAGLSAGISGSVTGGGYNLLDANLTVSPGTAAVVRPAPIPEPAGLAVFLVCALAVCVRARSRRLHSDPIF